MTAELYRHYDETGRLLYVGMSISSLNRWRAHKNNRAEWTPLSVRMDIQRFPTREDALAAEYKAIAAEQPIYNLNAGQKEISERDSMNPETLNPAYVLAIEAAKKITGKEWGAASWLAKRLGVGRQTLFYWSTAGFPADYVDEVSKITGVPKDEIAVVRIDMPASVWKHLSKRLPKSIIRQLSIKEGRK